MFGIRKRTVRGRIRALVLSLPVARTRVGDIRNCSVTLNNLLFVRVQQTCSVTLGLGAASGLFSLTSLTFERASW